MSKPEEFKFDSRVRDRFLRNRVLSTSELQKHLEELPDLEGQYDILSDTPQPAVSPPRSEVSEEPLMFDGIRRLSALGEAASAPPAPRHGVPAPASSAVPVAREPEARPLGTPLRSALMESEISGVGAGAVSAALGAMAAEARGGSVFGVPSSIQQQPPPAPAAEPGPPVTLRSEPSGATPAPSSEGDMTVAGLDDDDADDEDEDEDDDIDDESEDEDDDGGEEASAGEGSDADREDLA